MLRKIFFFSALAHFYYGIYYDRRYVNPPIFFRGGFFDTVGKWKYLTIWNMVLQAMYFTLCMVNDFHRTNGTGRPLIQKIRDYIFASVAFPVAMFVGLTFWALMFVDRELVFPKALDPYFPTWLNHVMHTNIMIFIIMDMCINYHVYPKQSRGLLGLILFMAVYLIWTHVIYYKSGIWTYPVLEVLNWWQRIIFFVCLLLLVAMLYALGGILNKVLWGRWTAEKPASASYLRKSNKKDK